MLDPLGTDLLLLRLMWSLIFGLGLGNFDPRVVKSVLILLPVIETLRALILLFLIIEQLARSRL